MRQNLDGRVSNEIEGVNVSKKIEEYLDYGRNNGGWNKMLDLDEFQEGVYLLDNTWQELGNRIKMGLENSKDIEGQIQEVNDKFDSLHKQAKEIKKLILGIGLMLDIEKRDVGVILRHLVDMGDQKLVGNLRVKAGMLVGLLNEFIVDYEEWKIFKENNLEKLNENLKAIGENKLVKSGIRSNYPSASRLNKGISHDTGWRRRNR